MRFHQSLFLAATLVSSAYSRVLDTRQTSLDTWVSQEELSARFGLFRNIGSQGEFAHSVNPGAVIASPSTSSPDYYFQWARDAAVVFKVLLNSYINGNSSIETFLEDYAAASDKLQRTQNPSGDYTSGGIGEPKFQAKDGSPFTGSWGRPQTDGPAIRATVLIKFANLLLDAGEGEYVASHLYDNNTPANKTIKADLGYVSNFWTTKGFDLWEEVNGQHFFNMMVQHRALIEGAELSTRLGDTVYATEYTKQASLIKSFLPNFWDSNKKYLKTSINSDHEYRDQLDCGTLLGALHGNGGRGFGIYQASSDEVLVTLQALVAVMKPLYPINSLSGAPGIAIGRYSSDVYDGAGTSVANPWFICTFTVAETLYTAVNEFKAKGSIAVTSLGESFFKQFYSSAAAGSSYASGSAGFSAIVGGMRTYADTFVATGQQHVANNGSLSEQFSRYDGYQKGARDLTWSYASFLTMKWARDGKTAY